MIAPSTGCPSCTICGARDSRTLCCTTLTTGSSVIVCGSHAVAHDRAPRRARTVSELRLMIGERRDPCDRRARFAGEVDELAVGLSTAFSRERRDAERRRTGT